MEPSLSIEEPMKVVIDVSWFVAESLSLPDSVERRTLERTGRVDFEEMALLTTERPLARFSDKQVNFII